jgi:uncharacterized membrane protein
MATTGSIVRGIGQLALGAFLLTAGISHLTRARKEFRAQVPTWVPVDPDKVVVGSGIVEIGLGTALVATWKQPARRRLGALVAAFFVAIFPGNIAQLVEHRTRSAWTPTASGRCGYWVSRCLSHGRWRRRASRVSTSSTTGDRLD